MARPEKWKDEYAKIVEVACSLGATDEELAEMLGVSVRTIYYWRQTKPKLCKAMVTGKAEADHRVERSLYNRAVGYTYDAEKIITVAQGGGVSGVERVPIKEHVPPDVTAQIFWLKNRRKDQWRDRIDNTHAGPDGGPIEMLAPADAVQRAAFMLAKAAKTSKGK